MRRLDLKRIIKEDFPSEYQEVIDKLAYPINSGFEQIQRGLDGQLDFANLNQEVINLDVTVNASGEPVVLTQYRSTLRTTVLGNSVIGASNLSVPQNTPTGQPFITFAQNGNQIRVNKITNLQPNERYLLTVISIGKNLPT